MAAVDAKKCDVCDEADYGPLEGWVVYEIRKKDVKTGKSIGKKIDFDICPKIACQAKVIKLIATDPEE